MLRRSRLVQIGFPIVALGLVPLLWVSVLITDDPIGLGWLFAFLGPVALFLIVIGTILSLRDDRAPLH